MIRDKAAPGSKSKGKGSKPSKKDDRADKRPHNADAVLARPIKQEPVDKSTPSKKHKEYQEDRYRQSSSRGDEWASSRSHREDRSRSPRRSKYDNRDDYRKHDDKRKKRDSRPRR